MGLLSDMGPLVSHEENLKLQPVLKNIAIRQFLHLLKKYRKWNKPQNKHSIKWGYQIQGNFLKKQNGSLKLLKQNILQDYQDPLFNLTMQFGSFMFQMTPQPPYNSTMNNLDEVIKSIRYNYKKMQSKEAISLTIPCIPFMGVRDFRLQAQFRNNVTKSQYISDDHIGQHPRFFAINQNILLNRKSNADIRVPLFKDQNTDLQQIKKTQQPYDGYIYLDSMCFGFGLSCLQLTFSTKNFDHARYLYDQLNVLSPLFLAITAGTPFIKGKISDWDARWNIISGAIDDRNQQQRDPNSPKHIPDSRYESCNFYIWDGQFNLPQYNDYDLKLSSQVKDQIKKQGKSLNIEVDDLLVDYTANLLKRNALIVYENFPKMSSKQSSVIQSIVGTNYNSIRLKIPTDDDIGWRVEFRTMEIQLTADQNAAFSLIIHLITRVLHQRGDFNFYIPITKLRQNFQRAHRKDALLKQKFYFRTNVLEKGEPVIEQLSIHEILFGNKTFKGIYSLLMENLSDQISKCEKVKTLTDCIEKFFKQKTTGKRLTLAQWMRNYVNNDKRYGKNSLLPKQVMDDMLLQLYEISKGKKYDETFAPIFQLDDVEINGDRMF